MQTSDIIGSALVVCVVLMLLSCSAEAFTVHKSHALQDLKYKANGQTEPKKPTYTTDQASKISTFTAHLADDGSIGHLNDMESAPRHVPNYDAPRDVQIDSRWVPDMDVPIERRSATIEDISAGNVPFDSLEYQRTRWADTSGCPRKYGISAHTHGKIVFGDEDEHRDVRDDYRTPLIDPLVTYGDYGRGNVSI
jgi:hypothetical protein